ncbi:MAG: amidohydrolase family protein [Alphaproteobacteria bacterium]
MQTANCDYGPTPTTRADIGPGAMIAHVAEGTGAAARNEFLCESSDTYDTLPLPAGGGVSHDWIVPNAALIHAVGLQKQDLKLVAARGASLIWSPRSNFSLYGKTLRLGDAEKLQINIALGADWLPSGSMNLNRELACASAYAAHLIHPLSDEDLWRMVTINAARAAHVDDALGAIEPGKTADLILVSRRGSNSFRAVTASTPASVQMVMRGGVVLYGNTAIVNALRPDCEAIAVAGATRALCPEAARPSAHALQAYADDTHIYPLAFKGRPANEPACWAQTGSRR